MKRRRLNRKGFIYIVGWRVLSTRERKPVVIGKCPDCGVDEARLVGRVRRAWFTMFFIPILPLDPAHRAVRISQCRECLQTFEMPIEQLARRAHASSGNTFANSILLYNQLRDRPNDGQLMLKLLTLYEHLREHHEAEAAARHFPEAIAANPACETALKRIRALANN